MKLNTRDVVVTTVTSLFYIFPLFQEGFAAFGFGSGSDQILLKDTKVLTLYHGKYTTSRRSSPIPQLKCIGGTAGCSSFMPQVVQCYNRGFDGYDVQWECKTDMDNAYRFGKVEVSCEGYEYPEDPHILRGSCGLEYTLDLTKEGHKQKQHGGGDQHNYYGDRNSQGYNGNAKRTESSGFGDLIMLVVVGVIIYAIYHTCLSSSRAAGEAGVDGDDTYRQGGPQGGNRPPPPGFRQDNMPGDGCGSSYNSGYGSGYGTGFGGRGYGGTGGTGGGGFWTGAATGGLLGYMFGGRGNTGYHNRQPYGRTGWGGGFGSGWGSGGGSSWGSSGSMGMGSSGTRTASGFGGTRRR
jgi:hypothetical protein